MNNKPKLRRIIEQRMEFIEFRLFWEGHVNRSDLTTRFGQSLNQATSDLTRYVSIAPDNAVYDKNARAYVRLPTFRPLYLEPDASRYLTQLRQVADGILDQQKSWLDHVPSLAITPIPARNVDPAKLRAVIGAIRHATATEVKYQSMSNPTPRWRWIAPHALAFDGFRWHARAFCHADKMFKDFLLSRILEIRGTEQAEATAADDHDWHTEVTLKIGPHPALTETQAKVIALDYGMHHHGAANQHTAGHNTESRNPESLTAEIKVRRALLYYTLRHLGLDTDPAARSPRDQQIVLLNRDELLGHERPTRPAVP